MSTLKIADYSNKYPAGQTGKKAFTIGQQDYKSDALSKPVINWMQKIVNEKNIHVGMPQEDFLKLENWVSDGKNPGTGLQRFFEQETRIALREAKKLQGGVGVNEAKRRMLNLLDRQLFYDRFQYIPYGDAPPHDSTFYCVDSRKQITEETTGAVKSKIGNWESFKDYISESAEAKKTASTICKETRKTRYQVFKDYIDYIGADVLNEK
jgi:hypothetical protein